MIIDCSETIFSLIWVCIIIMYMYHMTADKTQPNNKRDIEARYVIRQKIELFFKKT